MSTETKPFTYLSNKNLIRAGIDAYPLKNISSLLQQFSFCLKARKNKHLLIDFYSEINQLGYSHIFKLEPSLLGVLVWPYIHKDWDLSQRFSRIAMHYALLKGLPKFLDLSDGLSKQIVNLNAFSTDTYIVLDKPKWFVREGEIVLNIFNQDLRVMSLAFSLGNHNNELTIFVGGIQGIHSGVSSQESLKIIKHLTKDFYGLRPRSFVIAVLRIIATRIGVTKILAIGQLHRHHWHPFFKSAPKFLNNINYDDIWKDHDGIANGDGFYQLKTRVEHRDLSEVDSKKRSMYRKRFEMVNQIEQQILQLV